MLFFRLIAAVHFPFIGHKSQKGEVPVAHYQRFAYVYDKMNQDNFSRRMFRYTKRILTGLRCRPRSVLDLACGTGTAATMWAESGVRTCGIDGSEHMLEIARRKAEVQKLDITFSRQELTSFAIDEPVDLVTCYYDSLNYLLTLKDLTAAFRCVRRALVDGGYFIFDMNTPEAMKVIWGAQTYAEAHDDIAWIWKNLYFPKQKSAQIHATFFVQNKDKVYERFEEVHTERGYTNTELRRCLKSAGLRTADIFEALRFRKPRRDSLRVAIVAQKPATKQHRSKKR
jgi:ubiquinone/menaquinone biosynthesis C-methylase UbiE